MIRYKRENFFVPGCRIANTYLMLFGIKILVKRHYVMPDFGRPIRSIVTTYATSRKPEGLSHSYPTIVGYRRKIIINYP